ncbi:MAG: histidine phosphatase family protein [Paenibacillus macerans]|uniref:Histidine phosphatase super family protein n=1 Tax=Paenibacillus macerans TaxID=44252 RepID=A0A090ZVG5_PAEMA|nr:histidine phosphatase family protein [Paenibacillus macerans]KFN08091.1 histidine phosphatase super family protein [Paenibacillus macerans]MCY7556763.1 histidine phosphatase family protein [Paenibacillus macerans]MDU7474687.1 histidine phosphatase family protein [Paenibacillus macerans]MEC0152089.1 histidine phosphatase family protein [Paenibacillus macerans]SUA85040.1 fructose-2,6-bisphosphatase [Paenibacillus macerans]
MRIEWWLIRHGLTEWNVQHRYQGHSDPALLPGEASGLEPLRLELAGVDFSAVYSSDLVRCRQTLEYARPDLMERCVADRRLREMDFGAWEGRTYEMMKDDASYRAWIDDPQRVTPPGGESWQAFRARLEGVRQELAAYSQALAAGGRLRREDAGQIRGNVDGERIDAKEMRENAVTMGESAEEMRENAVTMGKPGGEMRENGELMQENVEVSGEHAEVVGEPAEPLWKCTGAMSEHIDVRLETSKVLPRNSRTIRLLIVTHGGVISLLSSMLEPGLGFWDTRLPPGGIKRLQWEQ